MLPGISNHLDLTAHSDGHEDMDDDAWTQISGPSDEEMSVSDDASIHTTVQCQTSKVILDALG